jgi:hypothetical protein
MMALSPNRVEHSKPVDDTPLFDLEGPVRIELSAGAENRYHQHRFEVVPLKEQTASAGGQRHA